MERNFTVYIDPSAKILYSSYYIQGLFDFFGKKNVKFSSKPFKSLKKRRDKEVYDHFMAFVVVGENSTSRYIIDFWDKTIVDEYAYSWCHCYGKINVSKDIIGEKEKLMVIPPGFGVKVWNRTETLRHCFTNFLKSNRDPNIAFKRHYEDYMDQFERPEISDYEFKQGQLELNGNKPYVFMIGRLWPHKNCLTSTNPLRLKFIETCKKLNIDFDGGLFAKTTHPDFDEYKEVIFTQKMDVNTYVKKTKKSAIVFNTPAVHDCHGWKLGEYLAMGKAIISTKLSNYFPVFNGDLLPMHTVLDSTKLENDLELLLNDQDYLNELSVRAQKYYLQYASPVKVIESMVNFKG